MSGWERKWSITERPRSNDMDFNPRDNVDFEDIHYGKDMPKEARILTPINGKQEWTRGKNRKRLQYFGGGRWSWRLKGPAGSWVQCSASRLVSQSRTSGKRSSQGSLLNIPRNIGVLVTYITRLDGVLSDYIRFAALIGFLIVELCHQFGKTVYNPGRNLVEDDRGTLSFTLF